MLAQQENDGHLGSMGKHRERLLQSAETPEAATRWEAVRFFKSREELKMTRNRLPHWQSEGACIFLTFRLADALPKEKLLQWREERRIWLENFPPPWTPERDAEYRLRFQTRIDRWLDAGYGCCLLADGSNAEIVAKALAFFDGDRCSMHGWVIMPNHVHALFSLVEGERLESLVGSWKGFTSRKIHARTGQCGSLWQKDYFDRLVRGPKHFRSIVRYLCRNAESAHEARLYLSDWVEKIS